MYMVISDPHVDDEQTLERYLEHYNDVIERYGIEFVLSAGDNGLLGKELATGLEAPFYTIYGNHDIPGLNNLKDGINTVGDKTVFAFNGIIAARPKYWFHRDLSDIVRLVFKNQREHPDIVITHEVPYGVTVPGNITVPAYLGAITFASQILKPTFHFYGHLHDRLTFIQVDYMYYTSFIRVDSSMMGHAVIVDDNNNVYAEYERDRDGQEYR